MEAKEKAQELIDKFYNTEHCPKNHFPNNRYCDCSEMSYFQAKQCAILACDEIIEVSRAYYRRYYTEVKEHLQNSQIE